VFSEVTNTAVAGIAVRARPYGIAFDSGKHDMYVASYGPNDVRVILISY